VTVKKLHLVGVHDRIFIAARPDIVAEHVWKNIQPIPERTALGGGGGTAPPVRDPRYYEVSKYPRCARDRENPHYYIAGTTECVKDPLKRT